jgi:hypothetical protein
LISVALERAKSERIETLLITPLELIAFEPCSTDQDQETISVDRECAGATRVR